DDDALRTHAQAVLDEIAHGDFALAFIGSKGGTGASTIAHNCAFGISNLFYTETILADLDLHYGTANIDFDQDPAQGIA
ncbi:hypothetical protein ACC841_36485, partial [Rhizobium ruizarguesonis]